jgi:glycine/D-amino acid oxidase-like deaminating enzyme
VTFETLREAELSRRYPQIAFAPGVTGTLEPESGALMARRAVHAVVEECTRLGCEYLHEAIEPPPREGTLEYLAASGGGRIRAGGFVFACGPWLGKIFPDILGKRLFPTRQEVFFFGVPAGDRRFAPPRMPVWIDFCDQEGPYGLPDLEGRGFKLAFDRHGGPFDPDSESRQVSAKGVAQARRYVARRFPALAGAPLIESRVCQYENTSSGDFLIDRHPELSNVWIAGGGSGHGFKHGPALGEYASSFVLEGGPAEPRFSLAGKAEVQRRAVH